MILGDNYANAVGSHCFVAHNYLEVNQDGLRNLTSQNSNDNTFRAGITGLGKYGRMQT